MAWPWHKKRVEAYQNIAYRTGWIFEEKPEDALLHTSLKHFKLFKLGSKKSIKYVLTSKTNNGDPAKVFEYDYVISTGKSSAQIIQHVCCIWARPEVGLPIFALKPQNALHTIGKWFGMQDIEFKNFDQFNKNYIVKAPNPEGVKKFITNDILGFLSYEKGWIIESDGKCIMLYKNGKRMKEDMIEPFIQVTMSIYALFVGDQKLDQGVDKPIKNKVEPKNKK